MLACVAGAKKGKDEGKIGSARNAWGEGERKRLQPAHCLLRLAPSLICNIPRPKRYARSQFSSLPSPF